MPLLEPACPPIVRPGGCDPRRGFTLPELLVALTIVLMLGSMAAVAVTAAGGQRKKLHTRALISKIDAIVASHYASYAGFNVAAVSGTSRGQVLRDIARDDLPDDWSVVANVAAKSESNLTAHQRAYAAVWNSLGDQARQAVAAQHASAECLFLTVMHGGLSGCLDCQSLRIDVGDVDVDGMPEFIDAWGRPISFVTFPSQLQLPPGGGIKFFSSALPFDPVMVTSLEAKGGAMRPLIVSAGPDGDQGLRPDAGPLAGSVANRDNLTNFDEEARR